MILASDLCLLLNYSVGRIYNGVVFHPKNTLGKGRWGVYVTGLGGNVMNTHIILTSNDAEIGVGNKTFTVDADVEVIKELFGLCILPRYSNQFSSQLLSEAEIIGKGTVENKEAYLLRLKNGMSAVVCRKALKELGRFMTIKGIGVKVDIGGGHGISVAKGTASIGSQPSYSYCWR